MGVGNHLVAITHYYFYHALLEQYDVIIFIMLFSKKWHAGERAKTIINKNDS